MAEFAALNPKTHSYLTNNNDENKKTKGTKKYAIKQKLEFEDYKNCLKANQLENETNHLEKTKLDTDSLKQITKNS